MAVFVQAVPGLRNRIAGNVWALSYDDTQAAMHMTNFDMLMK